MTTLKYNMQNIKEQLQQKTHLKDIRLRKLVSNGNKVSAYINQEKEPHLLKWNNKSDAFIIF